MIETDSNHCQIVAESLSGRREVDERTFNSIAVLGEKLERLKKYDKTFSDIVFSSAAEKLLRQKHTVPVG